MKIGFLITARLKSSRLPLKLLLDLAGKSIVERVIERTQLVSDIDTIVLCTSDNPQDKPLVDIAIKNKIYYFTGNETDVVKRLSDAAEFFGLDYVINITGENPLFSTYHANLMVDRVKKDHPDFIYIKGLPIGCAVYGIKASALKLVCEIKKEIDTEIWGALINQPDFFNVVNFEAATGFENIRVTIDYSEDYIFVKTIFSSIYQNNTVPDFDDMIALFKSRPEILEINKMHKQLALDPSKISEIQNHYHSIRPLINELKKKYNLQ